MTPQDEITFVNRVEELEALRGRISSETPGNSITFLRAPSGFGKTRLTHRLLETISPTDQICVIVDPSIRSKSRSERIYAWYFVQRAAEPSALASPDTVKIPSFAQFVRRKEFGRLNWKHVYENAKEIASISKASRFIIELGENLFKVGKYHPVAMLQDDNVFSTEIAQKYVTSLKTHGRIIFVIRECQNIDPESLGFFLSLARSPDCDIALIFEYTTNDGRFSPEHEKIILDTTGETSLVIFDLLRLNTREFRLLLEKYLDVDRTVEAAVELTWDGNLRIVKELQYRMMIGSTFDLNSQFKLLPTMTSNVDQLPRRRKAILATIAAHIEPIRFATLLTVFKEIDPRINAKKLESELSQLQKLHRYVHFDKHISLADEDVADAILSSSTMKPLVVLAETRLREFYLRAVKGGASAGSPINLILRQAIALCAQTGDLVALRDLIDTLDSSILQAADQTLYVNLVAGALISYHGSADSNQAEIAHWTAASAFEVGDYPTSTSILEDLTDTTPYTLALLASCYSEVNRNKDALALAETLEQVEVETTNHQKLAAGLIKCAALFAIGSKDQALDVHSAMRSNPKFIDSPLFGFVLRFTEIVKDFPECTEDVLKSGIALESHGLSKSASYSKLTAAVHLAYGGRLTEARELLAEAEKKLEPYVRDRQTIFNNSVVVELLSDSPNIEMCLEKLDRALVTVRDDFSRLALHNNRLICFWLKKEMNAAFHSARVIESILSSPNFGNRDVFWTVCFNACSFFDEMGETSLSRKFAGFLTDLNVEDGCYPNYWKKRYGMTSEEEPAFDFLLRFKYHPEYLSHWVIDLEGLSLLKEGHVQSHR